MGLFDWVNKVSAAKVDAKFPKTTQQDTPAKSASEQSEPIPSVPKASAPEPSAPEPSAPKASAPEPSASKISAPKPSSSEKSAPVDDSSTSSKLKQVLDSHQDCKVRLLAVLEGESVEVLDVDVVAADQHCVLGKWIYKEGKALYGDMPEYEPMRKAHAEFHIYAGEALKQHLQGNKVFADVIIKTKFRNTSNKNQLMLTSLFNAAKFR